MPTAPRRDDAHGTFAAVALTINRYLLRHVVRLYQAFDGDVLEGIVLGEVAHHNMSGVLGDAGTNLEFAQRIAAHGRPRPDQLLPTNAHSIALATGIPRETVRRKVAALVKRGWLHQDARANLTFTAAPGAHFRAFTEESVRELLDVADAVAMLRGDAPQARARPAPRRRR